MPTQNHLFCFGLGYTASYLVDTLRQKGWQCSGTCQSIEKQQQLQQRDIHAYYWQEGGDTAAIINALHNITHILVSIPPIDGRDSVAAIFDTAITQLPSLKWVGYLSTTGVYGDHQGEWVDETTPLTPNDLRSQHRMTAEAAWQALDIPLHIFRLAGIYGPGRSALDSIMHGKAQRIDKPGQYFSRIHVDDIIQVLRASMATPNPGSIYNVADNLPTSQSEVITYAATLLGITPPPLIPFEQAILSPMARSFYQNNRRVRNQKIKQELGITLHYPSYKEGLQAIAQEIL